MKKPILARVFAWFPLWRDANVVMAYLPSPSQLLPSPGGEHETPRFDPKVPAPEGQIAEVRYFVSLMDRDIDGLGQDVVFRLSAPTRPPSAHLVFEGLEGIRMVRPGEIASPEQVRQLVDALGGRAVLDIQQSENGTVQRVTIQSRRLRDETDSVNTGISTAATDPAPLPDRID